MLNQLLVDEEGPILRDCADGILRVARRTELVSDEHVELTADPVGDHRSDRDTPSGYPEHERNRLSVDQLDACECVGETLSGFLSIPIPHAASVPRTYAGSRRGQRLIITPDARTVGRSWKTVRLLLMRRLLLLANPSASGFTGARYRNVMSTLSADFDVDAEWPHGTDETRQRAARAASDGYTVVAAMGGDGVVHHAANGAAGTAAALAIIPTGTTNVAARIFGLPKNPVKAAAEIASLPVVPTRLARVESKTAGDTTVEFATFAVGVGFDADVVERAERRPHSKLQFGGVHYAESAISALLRDWRGRPANLRVDVDGSRCDGVAALTQVHHPYTYFGRIPLHIAPRPVNGLAAVVAEDLEVHRAAGIFARAVLRRPLGQHLGASLYTCFDRLTIEAEPATPFQADGEHLGAASLIEITPAPDALLVVRNPEKCCSEAAE